MNLGQLIGYNKRNIFFKNYPEDAAGRLVLDLFLFLKNTNMMWKQAVCSLSSIAVNLACNKIKLYKTSDYWSRDLPNFSFSGKDLGLVSPPHDFSRKMFLMLYSMNWPNFIVWLPLLLEILGNMRITIVCSPVCDVIKLTLSS